MDRDAETQEHPLSRTMLESGLVQKLALDRDGKNSGVLSEAELIASRQQYVADDYTGPDIWIFGYGSLIWNPLIAYEEKQSGRVFGFHKRFCLWTRLGRGSPEEPGLVLALDRGGSVRGVVFRIAAKHAAQELDILWRREMVNNSYSPKWVSVHTNYGVKKALSFVIRRNSPSFADRMSDENIAAIIAKATGFLGPCREYLFETAKALTKAGIQDDRLERLVSMVRKRKEKC